MAGFRVYVVVSVQYKVLISWKSVSLHVYLMSLNRSEPRLPPSSPKSTLDPRLLNSGSFGGGGPDGLAGMEGNGFVFSEETKMRLERLDSTPSDPRRRRNHPEVRFGWPSVAMLALLRLTGRGNMEAESPVVGPPLAYTASFSRLRLNKRRMLAGPLVETGELGAMAWSADRFRPLRWTSGVVWVPLLVAAGLARPSTGFCSSEGSSCIGEGNGGGMSVPSVREPNLRSRAGSWNLVPALLEKDGMIRRWQRPLEDVENIEWVF